MLSTADRLYFYFFLNTKISSSLSVLCKVDLTKHQAVSLQIQKVGTDPYCEMSIDSKVEEKIIVAAGSKASLSFLDCPNEDVRLTASQLIGKMFVSFLLSRAKYKMSSKS